MTAADTRPLPPHGTTARAKGRPHSGIPGCTQSCCRTARNRYDKRLRYLKATGRNPLVPAEPVAEHLRALLAGDTSWRQVAEAANVSRGTLHSILNGRKTVTRRVAERILAANPAPAERALVDAIGAIRRIRALTALGHSSKVIAAAGPVERSAVSLLLNGERSLIRYGTHARVVTAYEALSMKPPAPGMAMARARNRATREGWPPPLAWGEDIDDPAAVPSGHVPVRRSSADLTESSNELLALGVPMDVIAARLGVSLNALEKARERTAARERAAANAGGAT